MTATNTASSGPSPASAPRHDRLLPWIAAERAFRALVLVAVGIALVSHPHADWAAEISRLAQKLGLNPNDNWIQKLLDKIRRVSPDEDVLFGLVALAYGALEGTEAYGLFRRRRWAEWLTVIATSLLLIPEAWELTKSVTPLKLGGLIANLLVVAYLLWRLRRGARAGTRERVASTPPRRSTSGGAMTRKYVDCREMPSESGCDLTMAGSEEHVVEAAVTHAVTAHGHEDTPELREQIRESLKEEVPGALA